jgi:hypothetical protein
MVPAKPKPGTVADNKGSRALAAMDKELQKAKSQVAELRKAAQTAEANTAQKSAVGGLAAASTSTAAECADPVDQQIQQLQVVLTEAQATSELWRNKLFPKPGQFEEEIVGYKRELEALRAKKRGQLPAPQQLKQAQEFADRAAKRLEGCKTKRKEQQEAIAALQQQLVETEAEVAKHELESAAAAESVRSVSLQAAAAAASATSGTDTAAVSLVVPREAVEADPKLRECLEYLNRHTAMSSALPSSATSAPAPGGQGVPPVDQLQQQQAQHKLLQQQLEAMQRLDAERAEAVRLLEEQMDLDLSDTESLLPSEAGGDDSEPRKKRRELRQQRVAKRRKAFAEVKSKFG